MARKTQKNKRVQKKSRRKIRKDKKRRTQRGGGIFDGFLSKKEVSKAKLKESSTPVLDYFDDLNAKKQLGSLWFYMYKYIHCNNLPKPITKELLEMIIKELRKMTETEETDQMIETDEMTETDEMIETKKMIEILSDYSDQLKDLPEEKNTKDLSEEPESINVRQINLDGIADALKSVISSLDDQEKQKELNEMFSNNKIKQEIESISEFQSIQQAITSMYHTDTVFYKSQQKPDKMSMLNDQRKTKDEKERILMELKIAESNPMTNKGKDTFRTFIENILAYLKLTIKNGEDPISYEKLCSSNYSGDITIEYGSKTNINL